MSNRPRSSYFQEIIIINMFFCTEVVKLNKECPPVHYWRRNNALQTLMHWRAFFILIPPTPSNPVLSSRRHYQFTWMGEKETAETIVMSTLDTPSLVVLDPTTQYYYLPPAPPTDMTTQHLGAFLDDILQDKVQVGLYK